jgi:hypothetical protein
LLRQLKSEDLMREVLAAGAGGGADFGHTGSELSMVCFETLTSVVLNAEGAGDARRSLRSR